MKNVIVTLAEILLGIALFMLITGIGFKGDGKSLKDGATSVFTNIVSDMESSVIPGDIGIDPG